MKDRQFLSDDASTSPDDVAPGIGDLDATERHLLGMRSIVSALDVPAYALDRELRFTAFSDGFRAVHKASYGVEPRIGDHYAEGAEGEDERQAAFADFGRVLAGETVHSVSWRGRPGESRLWAIARSPIWRNGAVEGVVSFGSDMTDRHSREQTLLETEAMRDAAERVAGVGSFKVDFSTMKTTWSPEMFRLWQIDPVGFDGDLLRVIYERVHPTDLDRLRVKHPSLTPESMLDTTEFRLQLPDGTVRLLEASCEAQRDESGAVVGCVGYCLDITERRRTDERQRAAQTIMESLDVPVCAVDRELRYTAFNDAHVAATERAYGYAPAVGESCMAAYDGEPKRDALLADLDRVLAGDTVQSTDWRGDWGARRQWNTMRSPIWRDGEVVGIATVAQDTTERAFEELRTVERALVLNEVVAESRDAVFLGDSNGVITSCNKQAEQLCGSPAAEIVGQSGATYVAETSMDLYEDGLRRIALGEVVDIAFVEIQRRDGTTQEVSVHATPLTKESGEITGVAAAVRPIESAALRDPLTGLANRRGLREFGSRALALAKRGESSVGVLYADVDGMKLINDAFGHETGDLALQDAAALLRHTMREADVIARIGGDEFVVLASGVDADGIAVLASRFQAAVAESNANAGRDYSLSVSCGAVVRAAEEVESIQDLLRDADRDMYAEKARRAGA